MIILNYDYFFCESKAWYTGDGQIFILIADHPHGNLIGLFSGEIPHPST